MEPRNNRMIVRGFIDKCKLDISARIFHNFGGKTNPSITALLPLLLLRSYTQSVFEGYWSYRRDATDSLDGLHTSNMSHINTIRVRAHARPGKLKQIFFFNSSN